MEVATGVFARGGRRVGEVQQEIDAEREKEQREEGLGLVWWAGDSHRVGDRGE